MTLNQQAWDEYIQYRKKRNLSKLLDVTVVRMHTKLMRYTKKEQQEIIDYTLDNQYQGLFPEDVMRKKSFDKNLTTGLGGAF